MLIALTRFCPVEARPIENQELAMTCNDFRSTPAQMPSRSRLRYVQAHLQSDADAVLREIAYVLKLTQQVKQEILSEETEFETVGA